MHLVYIYIYMYKEKEKENPLSNFVWQFRFEFRKI